MNKENINYEKLYTDKCNQYRLDMDLRNNQVNAGKLRIEWLETQVKDLSSTERCSCFGWQIASVVGYAGIIGLIIYIKLSGL